MWRVRIAFRDPRRPKDDGRNRNLRGQWRPGDADLNTSLERTTTNDAAILEFDFVPTSPKHLFQYVFASDEYNDFVGEFNDVFGFFLTAPGGVAGEYRAVPGTNPPVSINNVNDGNRSKRISANPQFYVNNEFSACRRRRWIQN